MKKGHTYEIGYLDGWWFMKSPAKPFRDDLTFPMAHGATTTRSSKLSEILELLRRDLLERELIGATVFVPSEGEETR